MPDTLSRQTLDLVPGRCITFVIAIAKYPAIAAVLAAGGYNQAETDYVWTRLAKLGELPALPSGQQGTAKEVRDAVAELDAWDEKNFAVIRAVLQRFYPTFIDILFNNLEPKEGPEAVQSVSTLLNRLDALGTSDNPDAPAVLELLSTRGYSPAERARLRGLVQTATAFAPRAPLTDAARVAILTELYAWITDWATTARLKITRRQHLIALGIASPRKSEKEEEPGPVTPPAGPTDPPAGSKNPPGGEK